MHCASAYYEARRGQLIRECGGQRRLLNATTTLRPHSLTLCGDPEAPAKRPVPQSHAGPGAAHLNARTLGCASLSSDSRPLLRQFPRRQRTNSVAKAHDAVVNADIMALAQELAEISRLVDGDDVEATLARYVRRMVETVPDCDAAAIVVTGSESFEIAASHHRDTTDVSVDPSAGAVANADEVVADELVRPDSPMHDVLVYGEPRKIADTATEERWPRFSAAIRTARYRCCLMLPLPAHYGTAAGFALLSRKPDVFADTTYDLALLFALHAGVAFDNAQLFHDSRSLIDQLHTALRTRALIGQASGILMHRYDLRSEVAFEVLKRGSQINNLKLRDLAAELVQAQEEGTLAHALHAHGLTLSAGPT
jgi:hypothetical protein